MQLQQRHLIYEFGDFELDALRRVLVTRAGQPVEITGRVFEALVHFVERPGQLIEKKALIEALWPNVIVEDGNLTQTIHTLRRVLGETPGEHRYIATVPGRGYRFVAEVRMRDGSAAADPVPTRRPKWVLAGVALSLLMLGVIAVVVWRGREQPVADSAVRAPPSIAVLPFVDMSAEQDQVHFAEGLSEEILNLLAQAGTLRVTARTSSFSFKDQNADISSIAQRLSVSHVLEGSVRKSGERVRVTAQLIDGATSAHIWSETFDRDIHDIFGVQREIASAVADALHVTLGRLGPRRAETTSTQAYEHYLQGRHLFYRRGDEDILKAKSHFEQALQFDPDYGRAWSSLAGVYFAAKYQNLELPDAMQAWRRAAERAVAVAPELAEAHVRAAQYHWHAGDSATAEKHFERALILDREDPLVLGMLLSQSISEGRLNDAIAQQRRVVANDPLSATGHGNLGLLLMADGQLPDAQAELERALELSPAGIDMTAALADVLILQGRIGEALEYIAKVPEGFRRDQLHALAWFAQGKVNEGNSMLGRLLAQANKDLNPPLAVAIAEVYATRSDADRAFEWLDKAHSSVPSPHYSLPGWLMHENLQVAAYLRPLHADPRWDELLASTAKVSPPQ